MRFELKPFSFVPATSFSVLVAEHRERILMRIAVTGAHGTGKTTLVEDLA